MNKNFAGPFLKKLSTKLGTLSERSDDQHQVANDEEQKARLDTEKNLFAEFFKKSFVKTLSLVSEDIKEEFLSHLQSSAKKFTAHRQALLSVLVSVLTKGKEHDDTQAALDALAETTLKRLETPSEVPATVEDMGHETFHRAVSSMSDKRREKFVDNSVSVLLRSDEKTQRLVLAAVPLLSDHVQADLGRRTTQLNEWLRNAPKYPATPLALCDILVDLRQSKLTSLFQGTNDAQKKERFLVALSLVISCVLALRASTLGLYRLSWVTVAAPDMRVVALDLQTRFFVVEQKGNVLQLWLRSRLKQYNERASDLFVQLLNDQSCRDAVRQQIVALLPPRINVNQWDEAWIEIDRIEHLLIRRIWDTLTPRLPKDVFLPEHTLARETMTKVLKSMPNAFELDADQKKVRLGAKLVGMQPREVRAAVQNATRNLMNLEAEPFISAERSKEQDTLVDNLLREALEAMENLDGIRARRLALGVYEFQDKEVTFVVKNGQLYVYRVGNDVRQIPIVMWLNQEVQKVQLVPVSRTDTDAVEKVGKSAASMASWPFGMDDTRDTRREEKRGRAKTSKLSIPKPAVFETTVLTKKVKAATKATELNRRLIRRSISWDEDTLRKLMKVGLKKDMVWRESWNIFCQSSGLFTTDERDPKKHTVDSLTGFIEANLGEVLCRDWVKEFLVDPEIRRRVDPEAPTKRPSTSKPEPRRKKKKKEKKKKRKLNDSSSESSSDEGKPKAQWGENEAPISLPAEKKQKVEKNKKSRKIDDVDL